MPRPRPWSWLSLSFLGLRLCAVFPIQYAAQVVARVRALFLCHLLRSAGGDDVPALVSRARPQVHPVGVLYQVQVVLNEAKSSHYGRERAGVGGRIATQYSLLHWVIMHLTHRPREANIRECNDLSSWEMRSGFSLLHWTHCNWLITFPGNGMPS